MRYSRMRLVGAILVLMGSPLWTGIAHAGSDLQVADGLKVTLEYTLTLPDKTVADSNVGQAPFSYTQGAHQIVPGLEKALIGMKVGQTKRVEVAAQEAYGAYDQKARVTVEKGKVPAGVKTGDLLQSADGRTVKVLEVQDKTVLLDLNHPLAGKNLTFDVKVLKVEKPVPPAPEQKKK